ncbi:hypothetical protein GCM10010503_15570 [Streptomyces lucensis JCM 4490]|uniref:Uncharacterized protein n=1 Tax=Streptomyces lucensis JCM 4490 TaxID=1306176 RepID=A0A918IZV4_9ACTN|nr:hypothetical protein GCM10010503_15570 [Streptomyces lucensis JCM 4490]
MTTATGVTIAQAYQCFSHDRLSAETRAGRGDFSPRAVLSVCPGLAAVVMVIGSFAAEVWWFPQPRGAPFGAAAGKRVSPGLRVLRLPCGY